MQNKGAIRFFAIALALVCLFQLWFTVKTRMVEQDAKEFANGNPEKERAFLDSLWSKPVFNALLKNYTYAECKEQEISLGLDLKGGMHVVLEVSMADMIRALSNYNTDAAFNKALEDAQRMQNTSQKDFVTLFGEAFAKIDPHAKLAAIFATQEMQDRITFNSSNEDVLKIIHNEAEDATKRTEIILRARIDKFGVTSPNIQRLQGSERIQIELPGVIEPERVRKNLQVTAKLEFWETYEYNEISPFLNEADKVTQNIGKIASTASPDTAASAITNDSSKVTGQLARGNDSTAKAAINDTSKTSFLKKLGTADTSQTDSLNTALTGVSSLLSYIVKNEQATGPLIGLVLLKDTGKVNKMLALPEVKAVFPRDMRTLWGKKPTGKQDDLLELIAIKMSGRDNRAPLEGDAVTDARWDRNEMGSVEVTMSMNAEGAKTWRRLTAQNAPSGNKPGRCIAVVLDESVYSYPRVQSEIPNGRSSITGNFTIEEAKDLANILKSGKLPAAVHIVQEAVVGPSLGQEAIDAGLLSFVIALIVVLLFMLFYYSDAGLAADLALFSNVFFIVGVLASLQAVLTLPGIAGIVLTIGMSVDANILIFERIREELREGKGIRLSISDGFKHAYSSIIDSNVTTLLLGIILYFFGHGPIQGFATTLIIGILTSLFCAIFITRLIFEARLKKDKVIRFSNKLTENIFKNININFVGQRKYYYFISGLIILAGIVSFAYKGLSYGVDFKGGRTYVVEFNKPLNSGDIRTSLAKAFGEAPEVKTFGSAERFKITTTYLITDAEANAEAKVLEKLYEGVKGFIGNPGIEKFKEVHVVNSQKVGPVIASDIKVSAVIAVLLSCIVMFLYIFIRFKKWQFGLGATLALVHDVLVVLSCYTFFKDLLPFSLEIDQAFIAAILTVMGYSMNDTVVVFDRIREYVAEHGHKQDIKVVINNALNATLSRTINTSLTIFFVLLAIFIFGGDVIRSFSFAMLVGIVIGTYSSICIATPIVIDFRKKNVDGKKS